MSMDCRGFPRPELACPELACPELVEGSKGRRAAATRHSGRREATIRNPDNVPAKAGNQIPNNVIELSLDTPSTSLRVVSLSNHGSRPS